jgi:hypothetical protein
MQPIADCKVDFIKLATIIQENLLNFNEPIRMYWYYSLLMA